MGQFQPFLIAALVGLLVGVEREKADASSGTMGVRTFLLLSLLGALSGWLEPAWMGLLIAAFCLSLIVVSYFNSTRVMNPKVDPGLTTEVAGAAVFCLGYGAHQDPVLVAFLGPVVAIVLLSKRNLHTFTHKIRPNELEAAILLLLLGVGALNLLKDETLDPWGLFNPKKFGLLVLALGTLEFISYVAVKFFGEKKSALVVGALGGLVSSTATLLQAGKDAKQTNSWRRPAATALVATLASLAQVVLLVALAFPKLALAIAGPVTAAVIVGVSSLIFIERSAPQRSGPIELRSPLDLRGVLRLALLLAAILGVVALAQRWYGDAGASVVAFVTGLFELHGVSLATAALAAQGQMTIAAATTSLAIAILASLISKSVLVWISTRETFARVLTIIFIAMAFAAWAAWRFVPTVSN